MDTIRKKIYIILSIITIFVLGQTAYAQNFDVYSADDIFAEIKPEIPGPNQDVEMRLKSYSFNLNNYFITWFKNNEKVLSGYGERDLSFKTANIGKPTDITAVIEVGQKVYRKEYRFTPAMVDLIWEAVDAYAPPFYKGKKLPIKQSQIRVTAIPETQLIAPADSSKLIYYWDNNYERDIDASGFGKEYYEFTSNPIFDEENISVTTNDRRENSFAKNNIKIPTAAHNVKTLFYEINENDRILTNKALNSFGSINKPQTRLSFHPLNISTVEENFIDLFVDWKINNTSQAPQDFSKQNELAIAAADESTVSISIGVVTENIKKIIQKHTENINITLRK